LSTPHGNLTEAEFEFLEKESRMKKLFADLVVVGLGLVGAGLPALAASSRADLDARLDAATRVINEMMATPDKSIPDVITRNATCVAVVPSTKKDAFVVGGQ
jgi:SH3 domain-containing YSC84-like protein 1